MDMKYTYEELWKAYQRLQAENTALKQEIQQLKGRNIGAVSYTHLTLPTKLEV